MSDPASPYSNPDLHTRLGPPEWEYNYHWPVFVLGSPRSGTTTLQHEIRTRFGYRGHPESHTFSMMPEIERSIYTHFNQFGLRGCVEALEKPATSTVTCIDGYTLTDQLFDTLAVFVEHHYGGPYLDKTPGSAMIRMAPRLAARYPRARFIHVTRNGIENVASRLRKFPQDEFDHHCLDWKRCVQAWEKVKHELPADSYLDLRTEDFSENPKRVLCTIAEFLGANSSTLQELEQQEDLQLSHTERTGYRKESQDWSAEWRELFGEICGEEMERLGYPIDFDGGAPVNNITLPIPVGQNYIERYSSEKAPIFHKLLEGIPWLFMHPAMPEEPVTTLIYRNMTLTGMNHLKTRLSLDKDARAPVSVTVELHHTDRTEEPLFTRETQCAPAEEKDWDFDCPTLKNPVDIRIAVKMTGTTVNHRAWFLILPLLFSKEV